LSRAKPGSMPCAWMDEVRAAPPQAHSRNDSHSQQRTIASLRSPLSALRRIVAASVLRLPDGRRHRQGEAPTARGDPSGYATAHPRSEGKAASLPIRPAAWAEHRQHLDSRLASPRRHALRVGPCRSDRRREREAAMASRRSGPDGQRHGDNPIRARPIRSEGSAANHGNG